MLLMNAGLPTSEHRNRSGLLMKYVWGNSKDLEAIFTCQSNNIKPFAWRCGYGTTVQPAQAIYWQSAHQCYLFIVWQVEGTNRKCFAGCYPTSDQPWVDGVGLVYDQLNSAVVTQTYLSACREIPTFWKDPMQFYISPAAHATRRFFGYNSWLWRSMKKNQTVLKRGVPSQSFKLKLLYPESCYRLTMLL